MFLKGLFPTFQASKDPLNPELLPASTSPGKPEASRLESTSARSFEGCRLGFRGIFQNSYLGV